MENNLDITLACNKERFINSILFCSNVTFHKVKAYSIIDGKLIAYWYDGISSDKVMKLPYEMSLEQWAEFAWGWIDSQEVNLDLFGDGEWVKAFNIKCSNFITIESDKKDSEGIPLNYNHIDYAFMSITPSRIYYGK